jgi:hypothetical protein
VKVNTIQKRNITPAQAIKILEKNGIQATEEEARKILDFLYFLAKLAVHQYFNEKKD